MSAFFRAVIVIIVSCCLLTPAIGIGRALTGKEQLAHGGDGKCRNLGFDSGANDWVDTPDGRCQYVITITDAIGSVHCGGTLIGSQSVMTAGGCIGTVGSKMTVHLSWQVEGASGVMASGGQGFEVTNIITHPSWTWSIDDGMDVAVLILATKVDVQLPVLAGYTFKAHVNTMLFGLRPGAESIEILPMDLAGSEFSYTNSDASLFAYPGASLTPGSPIITADLPPCCTIEGGLPSMDVVVAVCSDISVVTNKGTAVRCTQISAIRDWLEEVRV